jgi:hypothetical protein
MTCREYLEMQIKAFGRERATLAAFVLDNGRSFAHDKLTFKGRRMRPKNCFGNATSLVMRDSSLVYCEGFVNAIIPIHHAWCMRRDGGIIDPTLSNKGINLDPREIADYFGVPFRLGFVLEFIHATGTYGLLDGMSRQSIDLITGTTPFPSLGEAA